MITHPCPNFYAEVRAWVTQVLVIAYPRYFCCILSLLRPVTSYSNQSNVIIVKRQLQIATNFIYIYIYINMCVCVCVYKYIWSKVNIGNVNCARQQHSFSTHERMFLWKCQVFETENVSTWEGLEPSTFGFMPNALNIWALSSNIYIYMYIYETHVYLHLSIISPSHPHKMIK